MGENRLVEPGQFSVSVGEQDGCAVVRLVGELDVYTVTELRAVLDELAGPTVVDLTGLSFMDSSGIGALVGANQRLRARGGSVAVVCAEGTVLRTLTITGVLRALTVRETLDAAMAELAAEG